MKISRDVEFRASDGNGNDSGRRLEGYAAVYDTDTEIRSWEGTFLERLSFGAFKKTLRENSNVMMQWDHGRDSRVGTTPIGKYDTIKEERGKGLFVGGDLFENDVVEPVRQAIEAGAVTGMSIAMQVMRDEWRDAKGKLIKPDELRSLLWADPSDPALAGRLPLKRNVKEVRLGEAGPVGRPAYKTTSVGVRSAEDMEEEERSQLLDSYRKTMRYEETRDAEEEEDNSADDELRAWIEAEERYNTDYQLWLDAETAYRDDVRSWLDAESEYRKLHTSEEDSSAVRKHTLWEANRNSPEDADRKVTSERDGSTSKSNHQKEVRGMTLQELRARLAEIEKRQGEIATEYRDAALPEAEDKEWDELSTEETDVRSEIEKIERRAAKVIQTTETRSTEDSTERGGSAAYHADKDIYDLDALRKDSYSSEDFVTRATDNARKAVERSVLPEVHGSDDAKSKAHLDKLLSQDEENGWLAKRALVTGTKIYERAFAKAMRFGTKDVLSLEERQAVERAIAISPTSAGGLAVPIQLDPTLVHLDAAGGYISPIRQLAKIITLTGRDYTTLSITQVDAVRAGEAAAAQDSSPTLAEAKQNVTKVHTFVPFSMEAEEDWAGLRAEVFQLIAEAKAREEAQSFLFGAGTALTPQGLFTGATQTVPVGGAIGGGTLTHGDAIALQESLPVEYEANAVWVGGKPTFTRLRAIPATGGGSATFTELQGATANNYLDTPFYRVAGAGLGDSRSATAGQKFLLYGDVRKAYTILDRVGMDIELIPMLFSANVSAVNTPTGVLPTGQRGFYAHWRNYGKVVNADAIRALVTR